MDKNTKPGDTRAAWYKTDAALTFGEGLEALREMFGKTRRSIQAETGRSYTVIRGLEVGDRWPSNKVLSDLENVFRPASRLTGGDLDRLIESRDQLLASLSVSPSDTGVQLKWLMALGEKFEFETEKIGTVVEWESEERVAQFDLGVSMKLRKDLVPKVTSKQPLDSSAFLKWMIVQSKIASERRVEAAATPFDHAAAFADLTATPVSPRLEAVLGRMTPNELALVEGYAQRVIEARPEKSPPSPSA